MIEQNHEMIDIDEVVKSLQEAQEQQVVQPEPVSSEGARTIVMRASLSLSPLVSLLTLLQSRLSS